MAYDENFSYPDNFKEGTKPPKARPDENMVEEHCNEGPDWKTGTVEPQCSPIYVTTDEGQHDEITSIDTGRYGSDFEPKPLLPRASRMPRGQ